MLDLLPSLPDPVTLADMGWWAAVGAAIGFGVWGIIRLAGRVADRNMRFGEVDERSPPAVEVPGVPPAGKDLGGGSPGAALPAALGGALVGAFMRWGQDAPAEFGPRLELVMGAFSLLIALVVLIRLLRSGPAVGEAPPEDPDATVTAQLPAAALEVAVAVVALVVAWFILA